MTFYGKLFGTDGIRGVANEFPMTPELSLALGKAVARYGGKGRGIVVIGKDTRLSGDMIESALMSGVMSQGVDVRLAGVLPTPGLAFLTAFYKADAGIMVSASHNPFFDNGIKIFKSDGFKLADDQEAKIQELLSPEPPDIRSSGLRDVGKATFIQGAAEPYMDFLLAPFTEKLDIGRLKVVMDCSNGATYHVAPQLFHKLGATIRTIAVNPDGKNINDGCGSEHPETVSKEVTSWGADIGLAFDGDGDRLIAIDEKGRVVSGDKIIAICAGALKKRGRLKNDTVVTTVMSNIGLRVALKAMGIRHLEAPVGDRYVLAQMHQSGSILGGEDSGHILFLDHHTTGDGIYTALRLIEAMQFEGEPLSRLADNMRIFPQILINVPVRDKIPIESVPEVMEGILTAEKALGERGRVLVRYSGTQPLCRVMVEGPSDDETRAHCERIASVIREVFGEK